MRDMVCREAAGAGAPCKRESLFALYYRRLDIFHI